MPTLKCLYVAFLNVTATDWQKHKYNTGLAGGVFFLKINKSNIKIPTIVPSVDS